MGLSGTPCGIEHTYFSVTLKQNRELKCLEDFQALLLPRMTSLRCWPQPPTLGPTTARRRWSSTSSRRRTTGSTSSTSRRPGRRSCWPPAPLLPWRTHRTCSCVPAGPTPRQRPATGPLPAPASRLHRLLQQPTGEVPPTGDHVILNPTDLVMIYAGTAGVLALASHFCLTLKYTN